MLTRNDQRAIAAEFLATLFFVFIGCGAVIATELVFLQGAIGGGELGRFDNGRLLVISLAHGLAILVAVAWTAKLSGGHINPAVTVAMIIAGKTKPMLGVIYIVAQCVGAIVGALLLMLVIPESDGVNFEGSLGKHTLNQAMSVGEGMALEGILTFFLVLVVFNVAVSSKGWGDFAPIAVGIAVLIIHFVAVFWTGASVNPARSLGPAIVDNEWGDDYFQDFLLLYIVAPVIGGAVAAGAWLFWRNFGDDKLDEGDPPAAPAPTTAGTPAAGS